MLSKEERATYLQLGHESLKQLLSESKRQCDAAAHCHPTDARWVEVGNKQGISTFRNTASSSVMSKQHTASSNNTCEVGTKTKFTGQLSDIARIYQPESEDERHRMWQRLDPKIIDSVSVETIQHPSVSHPYQSTSVHWFAKTTPVPIIANRDFFVLETIDLVRDENIPGSPLTLVRVLQSIESSGNLHCPLSIVDGNSSSFVRSGLFQGFIYKADLSQPNMIQAHHLVHFSPCKGYFPSQLVMKFTASTAFDTLLQLRLAVEELNPRDFLDRSSWVANRLRRECTVCERPFNYLLRKKHHCRRCGDIICSRCSVVKDLKLSQGVVKVLRVRICTICTANANQVPSMDRPPSIVVRDMRRNVRTMSLLSDMSTDNCSDMAAAIDSVDAMMTTDSRHTTRDGDNDARTNTTLSSSATLDLSYLSDSVKKKRNFSDAGHYSKSTPLTAVGDKLLCINTASSLLRQDRTRSLIQNQQATTEEQLEEQIEMEKRRAETSAETMKALCAMHDYHDSEVCENVMASLVHLLEGVLPLYCNQGGSSSSVVIKSPDSSVTGVCRILKAAGFTRINAIMAFEMKADWNHVKKVNVENNIKHVLDALRNYDAIE